MAPAVPLVVTMLVAALASPHQNAEGTLDETRPQLIRLKPANAEMRRLVIDGHQKSATFRSLVDEIHRSNAVVAVQFGLCANGRYRSCVSHVEGDDRQRHVRVKIQARGTEDRLIATIAHELQHVVEILREPGVTNAERALALYRRIGLGKCREGLSEACETEEARAIEARVLEEFHATPRR